MRNPIGITVEDGIVEVASLEFEICIEDGLHLIVFLHHHQPSQHRILEFLVCLVLRLMFHVKHRRQVAILQFDGTDIVPSLLLCWRMYAVEMISSAGEAVLTGLIEIIAEVLVGLGSAP